MKKVLAALVLMGLILMGCSPQSHRLEPTDYDEVNNLEGVQLVVVPDSISATGLSTRLENTTDQEFTFGEPYVLETKREDEWYKVPYATEEDAAFIDIGYILPPHDTAEWAVNWDDLYGALEPGSYRIVKDILDVYEGGGYENYRLAAEFEIE